MCASKCSVNQISFCTLAFSFEYILAVSTVQVIVWIYGQALLSFIASHRIHKMPWNKDFVVQLNGHATLYSSCNLSNTAVCCQISALPLLTYSFVCVCERESGILFQPTEKLKRRMHKQHQPITTVKMEKK